MNILGMPLIDWLVILVYFAGMIGIGLWSKKFIRSTDDFFLGGRRFGKLLVTFSSWGMSTSADAPVGTAAKSFQRGFSGIWLNLFWVFLTPFYWLRQVWFRRLRYVTTGDFLQARYRDRGLTAVYGIFAIAFFMAFISAGLSAAGKTVEALTPIPVGRFTAEADQQLAALAAQTAAGQPLLPETRAAVQQILENEASYKKDEKTGQIEERSELSPHQLLSVYRSREFENLKKIAQLTDTQKARFKQLSDEQPQSSFSWLPLVVVVPLMSLIVLIYGLAGGLPAAVYTDFIQGWLMIIMSFILIPFALYHVGGFAGLHERVPEHLFDMFTSATASEFTWYVVLFGIVPINIFVAMAGPEVMGRANMAKNEYDAQYGEVSGSFIKRLSTIGWALTGVLCLGLFTGLADPDHIWGYATRQLLGPLGLGLVGLMTASLLAAIMSSADAYMVACGALFVQNVYKPFWPKEPKHVVQAGETLTTIAARYTSAAHPVTVEGIIRRNTLSGVRIKAGQELFIPEATSEAHYLRVGRLVSGVLILGGVVIALWYQNVVAQFKLIWDFMSVFAAVFWLGLFWRRATRAAAWITFLLSFAFFRLVPFILLNAGVDPQQYPLLDAKTKTFEKVYTDLKSSEQDVERSRKRLMAWEAKLQPLRERLPAATGAEKAQLEAEIAQLEAADPRRPQRITIADKEYLVSDFALQKGEKISVLDRSPGRRIFVDKGVNVDLLLLHVFYPLARQATGPEGQPIRDQQGRPVYAGTISNSQLELLQYPLQIIIPLLLMFVVSLLTKPVAYDDLTPFYARLHTPVVPLDPLADAQAVQETTEHPERIEKDKYFLWWKLPDRCNWEFSSWERKDWLGLIVVSAIMFAIVFLAYLVTQLGG